MARAKKIVNVYERIENKKEEIVREEKELEKLNKELQMLFNERDDLEMHQLLEKVRESGLDIVSALNKLNVDKPKEKDENKEK